MKLKNLKVARWPFFIFHFLFNCSRYQRNNDRYKQVQTKYKRPTVLIFIFDKVECQVHIGKIFYTKNLAPLDQTKFVSSVKFFYIKNFFIYYGPLINF